jgi:hypothetical protein
VAWLEGRRNFTTISSPSAKVALFKLKESLPLKVVLGVGLDAADGFL